MSITRIGGNDSAGNLTQRLYITESQTFTAPTTGFYRVQVCGAAGGAGSDSNNGEAEAGGGGGGYAVGRVFLTAGDQVAMTVPGSVASANESKAPDGGTASFGVFLSATGGTGGDSTPGALVAGSGGNGVGGDLQIGGNDGAIAPSGSGPGANGGIAKTGQSLAAPNVFPASRRDALNSAGAILGLGGDFTHGNGTVGGGASSTNGGASGAGLIIIDIPLTGV